MLAQELIHAYSPANPSFLNLMIASAVAFGFGYWVYAYSILLMIRERKSPYPVWMHTFYFACDVTGTVFWFLLARQHDWFWFFSACSVAMAVWVVCEVWSLYMAVKYERQEAFGDLYQEPVMESQAINRIVAMIIWSFCIVNLMNYFLGGLEDAAMFKWYVWTNLIVAVGPTDLWAKRKNREGTGIGISIMILCSIIATYLPPGFGMWTTASPYFNSPWFYISGIVATGYAIHNLIVVLKFEPKPAMLNGRKTVW